MLDLGFYNIDCMKAMREMPDKCFDLAIVDPVYGEVTKGGSIGKNKHRGGTVNNLEYLTGVR